jgi:hypothetical protein
MVDSYENATVVTISYDPDKVVDFRFRDSEGVLKRASQSVETTIQEYRNLTQSAAETGADTLTERTVDAGVVTTVRAIAKPESGPMWKIEVSTEVRQLYRVVEEVIEE